MFLGWKNIIELYINLLNQKIESLELERSTLINLGQQIYGQFIDLYEFDNHLYLYKEIHKALRKMKNRCRNDDRRIDHP